MIWVNDNGEINFSGISQHGGHLCFGNGLLGLESTVCQCKPAAVHRNLRIHGGCHISTVGEGVFGALQLEAQTIVQGLCCEFTGHGLIGTEGQTCFDVDDTEFRSNQNIAVIFLFACQVAKVVVGIVVLFYGHFESGNQLLYPFTAGHFARFGHCLRGHRQCGRQQCRCQSNQQDKKNKPFLHISNLVSLTVQYCNNVISFIIYNLAVIVNETINAARKIVRIV